MNCFFGQVTVIDEVCVTLTDDATAIKLAKEKGNGEIPTEDGFAVAREQALEIYFIQRASASHCT